jgi:uncharacterized protein
MFLPDINVWLALVFSQHKHNGAAKLWFDALPEDQRCFFCRFTQIGFLRLSTNPKANPLQTQTLTQAWATYDTTLLDPRIGFFDEPNGLETPWRQWTQLRTFSPNVWNDAYLAAFAQSGALTVVTFDAGFSQFAGLSVLILT